jgi:hypothetical protein
MGVLHVAARVTDEVMGHSESAIVERRLANGPSSVQYTVVTWCDDGGRLTVGFLLSAGLWLLAQHRGLSPSPQLVPAAPPAPFGARRADIEFFAESRKPVAGPGPPSPADYAPSPGSTGTPSKKNSSTIHPQRTCGGCGWTTNPGRWDWTAPSSPPSWSQPGSACRWNMHSSACSPSTGYGCLKPQAPTSKRSASSTTTGRW